MALDVNKVIKQIWKDSKCDWSEVKSKLQSAYQAVKSETGNVKTPKQVSSKWDAQPLKVNEAVAKAIKLVESASKKKLFFKEGPNLYDPYHEDDDIDDSNFYTDDLPEDDFDFEDDDYFEEDARSMRRVKGQRNRAL